MSTPAGWYPDPAGTPQQRWWDGVQWTDQLAGGVPTGPAAYQQQRYVAAPLKAPDGTSPHTIWAWLIAVTVAAQGLLVIPILVTYSQVMPRLMSVAAEMGTSSTASSAYMREMMGVYGQLFGSSFGYIALSWLLVGASILFAGLDWRELKARGVPQPFHWAYAFFAFVGASVFVYLIGRTVVLRRRTGNGGGGPLWVVIAITVAGTIGAIVWSSFLVGSMVAQMAPLITDR
jgi:hypothetical protein